MSETSPSPERTPSLEELKELRWADLLDEALTMPGMLSNTYTRFYRYSFQNQVLLMMQGVREPVATLKRWNDMGRRVLPGSRAAYVRRPFFKKELDERGQEVQKLKGFTWSKSAFRVSQTEGDPLPEVEIPDWNPEAALKNLEIEEVPFEHLDGNIAGYSHERQVAISPVAPYPFKTLVHEVGHVLLGHTSGEDEDYWSHRGVAEFQAESIAYLTLNELGASEHMDAAESRAYIQHWLSGETPEDGAIRQVFSSVDQILRGGREQS